MSDGLDRVGLLEQRINQAVDRAVGFEMSIAELRGYIRVCQTDRERLRRDLEALEQRMNGLVKRLTVFERERVRWDWADQTGRRLTVLEGIKTEHGLLQERVNDLTERVEHWKRQRFNYTDAGPARLMGQQQQSNPETVACAVTMRQAEFRGRIRDVLGCYGIRSNPGWSDEDVLAAIAELGERGKASRP